MEERLKDLIQQLLKQSGYTLNDEEITLDDVVEQLGHTFEQLIKEWIEETEENYPECFKR